VSGHDKMTRAKNQAHVRYWKRREPIQMVEMAPGPDPNEMVTGLGYGLSLGIISPHLLTARAHRGANTLHAGRGGSGNLSRPLHPSRQSFGTARRIRKFRKPLGLNP
jgi:hypothetical protein